MRAWWLYQHYHCKAGGATPCDSLQTPEVPTYTNFVFQWQEEQMLLWERSLAMCSFWKECPKSETSYIIKIVGERQKLLQFQCCKGTWMKTLEHWGSRSTGQNNYNQKLQKAKGLSELLDRFCGGKKFQVETTMKKKSTRQNSIEVSTSWRIHAGMYSVLHTSIPENGIWVLIWHAIQRTWGNFWCHKMWNLHTCRLGTEIGWITAVVIPAFGAEGPIVKETEVLFFWALNKIFS